MSIHDQIPLPYPEPGGEEFTGGWAGSETSHARALEEVRSGRAYDRREKIMAALVRAGTDGMTCSEIEDYFGGKPNGWGHGAASGAITNMHEGEVIARLDEREINRHGGAIYVMPEFVNGRPTRRKGNTKAGAAAKYAERERITRMIDKLARMEFPYGDPFGRGWQRACVSILALLGEDN